MAIQPAKLQVLERFPPTRSGFFGQFAEPETLTKRSVRIQNALKFLRLVELKAGGPEGAREIMKKLLMENE